MEFFFSFSAFIVALGVLIVTHELGHFLVARKCGIHVERFSIGFGKALWRKVDRHGTEFIIAIIPLGGYVKMLDERLAYVTPERRHFAFNNKTVAQRAAVISAGPIGNFLLAIFVYWLVFIIGIPSVRPVIEDIQGNSIADKAGILPGMEFKSIDGTETPDWNSVYLALMSKIGHKELSVKVSSIDDAILLKKVIDLREWYFDPETQDPVLSLGIMPVSIRQDNIVRNIQPGSVAASSELKIGDRIIKVGEQIIDCWHPFTNFIRTHPNIPLLLTVERQGTKHQLILTPEVKRIAKGQLIGFTGIELSLIPIPDKYKITHQHSLFDALKKATDKTWQLIKLTVNMMGKLVTGDIKFTNLSGPVSIAKQASISAGSGLIYYLMFIALISVNLGIVNLFPFPVLDGGHLLFLLIEKIKGKPVSECVQNFSYRIGAIALILLMGLALFNDFSRL
ncbi:MAG: sigma E protease regulator RseP [Candidatus Arsenophonus melophagi]|nr:sigma E protease regulator RseP [Candidatus Arsenophonus melophagi]